MLDTLFPRQAQRVPGIHKDFYSNVVMHDSYTALDRLSTASLQRAAPAIHSFAEATTTSSLMIRGDRSFYLIQRDVELTPATTQPLRLVLWTPTDVADFQRTMAQDLTDPNRLHSYGLMALVVECGPSH